MGSSETTVSSDKEKVKILEQKLAENEPRQEQRRRFGGLPAGSDEGKRFFTLGKEHTIHTCKVCSRKWSTRQMVMFGRRFCRYASKIWV